MIMKEAKPVGVLKIRLHYIQQECLRPVSYTTQADLVKIDRRLNMLVPKHWLTP